MLADDTASKVDFGFRASRIVRRLRQAIDAELRAFGLTEATWRPLAYIRRLGNGVHQKDLAVALGVEGPSVARLLDSLERRGLVERREDEADRRARGVHLTQEGVALARRASTLSADIQAQLLAEVAPADLEAFHRVLGTVERALDVRNEAAARNNRRKP